MAQDHGPCRKKKQSNGPGARAATAGPCCSCQRDSSRSLQTCCLTDDPGAHGRNRGQTKQNDWTGARTLRRAVGMAKASRHTACRFSARHWPQDTQPAVGRSRSETTAADKVGRPFAVQCRLMGECSGAGSQEGWCRPTYCPYPTYRLCLSLYLPTPLI